MWMYQVLQGLEQRAVFQACMIRSAPMPTVGGVEAVGLMQQALGAALNRMALNAVVQKGHCHCEEDCRLYLWGSER